MVTYTLVFIDLSKTDEHQVMQSCKRIMSLYSNISEIRLMLSLGMDLCDDYVCLMRKDVYGFNVNISAKIHFKGRKIGEGVPL